MPAYFSRVFIAILLLSWMSAIQAAPRDPYKYFFNETWWNFQEELANAREQGKQGILIFFEMDECPFCHYMKTNVLNQEDVQEYYRKHFLNFSVDIEGDVEMTNLQGEHTKQKDFAFKEFRVRATPVIMYFDLDGKPIYRHTGKTSGKEEFMWIAEYIVEGHYKKEPFARFKREKRKQASGR